MEKVCCGKEVEKVGEVRRCIKPRSFPQSFNRKRWVVFHESHSAKSAMNRRLSEFYTVYTASTTTTTKIFIYFFSFFKKTEFRDRDTKVTVARKVKGKEKDKRKRADARIVSSVRNKESLQSA